MATVPIGVRFSQVYLARGAPTSDSVRFRTRLAAALENTVKENEDRNLLARRFTEELGVKVPYGTYSYKPQDVLRDGDLRDVLDAITEVHFFLGYKAHTLPSWQRRVEWWKEFVARALREENLGYRLDEECGVHVYVDEEFERSKAATLAVLGDQKFANARACYEDAYRHMEASPSDTKPAVRALFEAAEVLAKQLCPGTQNLNRWLAENTLKKTYLETFELDATEQRVIEGVFDSFGVWVNAVHMYRHGQNAPEPVAPSEATAVYVLSSGSAFIRLLADCYLRSQNGAPAG